MLVALVFLSLTAPPEAGSSAAFLQAVRAGDADAVRSLLVAGVPADTKARYERTALSFAADRGFVEIAKLLIGHGADVNARDTYYQATALDLAVHNGHVDMVRLLLEHGANGGRALKAGVESGNEALVQLALERTGPTPEALTAALAAATKAGHEEIVAKLRQAGAAPPAPANVPLPPESLASYAGRYRCGERGNEVTLVVRDGGLVCTSCGPEPLALGAMSASTLRALEFNGMTITFKLENQRVAGFTLNDWGRSSECPRAEEGQP